MSEEDGKPYAISVHFTYQECGACGAIHIPNGEWTPDCWVCRTYLRVIEIWKRDGPPSKV